MLTWFLHDVADPAVLVTTPRRQPAPRPLYGGRQLPRFRSFVAARAFGARRRTRLASGPVPR